MCRADGEDGQAADKDPLATQVVAEGARDEEQPAKTSV